MLEQELGTTSLEEEEDKILSSLSSKKQEQRYNSGQAEEQTEGWDLGWKSVEPLSSLEERSSQGTKQQDEAELGKITPTVPKVPGSNISEKMKIFEGVGGGTGEAKVKRIVKRGRRRKNVGDTLGAGLTQLGIHRFIVRIPPTDKVEEGVCLKGENQTKKIGEDMEGGPKLEFLTVLDGMRKKRRLSGGVHTPDKKLKSFNM